MTDERCDNCRFSRPGMLWDGERKTECHRFPPHRLKDYRGEVSSWPNVPAYGWCGEWQPSPQEAKHG